MGLNSSTFLKTYRCLGGVWIYEQTPKIHVLEKRSDYVLKAFKTIIGSIVNKIGSRRFANLDN